MKIYLVIIWMLLATFESMSKPITDQQLKREINQSALIVKAELVKSYSQEEPIQRYIKDQNKTTLATVEKSIFTTYFFHVHEVFKGSLSDKLIKVMMLGGCDKKLGYCDEYSFNYAYEIGEMGLLFLTFNDDSGAYQATHGDHSVFSISDQGELIRKSEISAYTEFQKGKVTFDEQGQARIYEPLSFSKLQSTMDALEEENES